MPPATHSGIRVERDIPVEAADGVSLLTDHWFAPDAAGTTVLVRTPYGRAGVTAWCRFLAERGHHVVVQSCRGTFGSGGTFNPLHDEVRDGQATMRWLRAQPWATGPVHSFGFSYFGVTQWALCDGDDRPDAMVIGVSSRRFDESIIYSGGGFAIETGVVWCYALGTQERSLLVRLLSLLVAKPRVRRGALAVPPEDAVLVARGHRAPFFEDWLAHDAPDDPWWEPLHFADRPGSTPPVTLLAGWQDLFLTGGFADYRALRDRGDAARLIVGDWTHQSPDPGVVAVRELLRGLADLAATHAAAPLRVEVTGGAGWRELAEWPPPATPRAWLLTPGGRLEAGGAGPEASVAYRYDPADPTPQAGGRSLNPFESGRRDQRVRERRDDVLVFTSAPLTADLTVIGDVEVDLTFTSTNPRVDFFLRLCDVGDKGSVSITDAFVRMDADAAPGARRTTTVRLSPTAHRFAAGHCGCHCRL